MTDTDVLCGSADTLCAPLFHDAAPQVFQNFHTIGSSFDWLTCKTVVDTPSRLWCLTCNPVVAHSRLTVNTPAIGVHMEILEKAGQSGHKGETYNIKVSGPNLDFRVIDIDDPKPTGEQIVTAAGRQPVEDYAVLQWLETGDLEPLRLNETTDLRGDGKKRFIVAKTDVAFFFELEGVRQEWLVAFINGITLKRLAKKEGDRFIVLREREDEPDEEIDDDQIVDLAQPGLEKFRIRAVEKLVEISVNTKRVLMERGEHTGLEIKQAAIAQGVNIQLDFVLSLEKHHGETQIIGDNDPVKVKKGQSYVAIADDDNS